MVSVSDATESIGKLRKLAQDVLAPELQGIKATLESLHDGQNLIRDEIKMVRGDIGDVRKDLKEQEARLRSEMRDQELRILKELDSSLRELTLKIRLADSERQVAELSKRLQLSSGQPAPPSQ